MSKHSKMITMVIAMALLICGLVVTGVTDAKAAAVKLNKKTATIYVDETLQLKVKGAKQVTWKSSDKKVAIVTKTGLVKGVNEGACEIIMTDKKTKKSYTCEVTVQPLGTLDVTKEDIWLFTGGKTIAYDKPKVQGASYYVDGQKVKLQKGDIFRVKEASGRMYTCVTLSEKLSDGEHTIEIRKKGYASVVTTLSFESIKADGVFVKDPATNGRIVFIYGNPELEGKTFTITFDGKEMKPSSQFLNGDGYYMIWVKIGDVSAGEHTITLNADGFEEGTAKITINN